MTWLLQLVKDGESWAGAESFADALAGVQAGNSALRSGSADDVTIKHRDHDDVYYQFSSVRTSSEEQRIARMLEDELLKARGEPQST